MNQPRQEGETQAGSSQSDLNQGQKLELIEGQLLVLVSEVHQLREELAEAPEPSPKEEGTE